MKNCTKIFIYMCVYELLSDNEIQKKDNYKQD